MDKDLKESADYKSLLDGLEKISVMPCQEMVRNNNDVFIHGVSAVAMSAVRDLKAENEQLKSRQEQNPHGKSHGMKKDEVIWSVFMVIACAIAICSGCRYILEVIDGNRWSYFFQGIMLVVNLCIGFCYLKRLITLDVIPKNKENEEGCKTE